MIEEELLGRLGKIARRFEADAILLSGGLDTSTIALVSGVKKAVTTVFKDAPGKDAYYSKLLSDFLGIERHLIELTVQDAFKASRRIVSMLKTFDPVEVRNDIPILLAIDKAKELGFRKVLTGDGGDELFAGYEFMVRMNVDELNEYIKKLKKNWRFSSKELGDKLGVKVYQPFLEEGFVEFAVGLPANLKVGVKDGKRYGKWILRLALDGKLPNEIVWRDKEPIELGSGATSLSKIFPSYVSDEEYFKLSNEVKLRDKEHAYYYKLFKREIGEVPKPKEGEKVCPYCGAGVPPFSKHCKVCGGYPV